MDSFELNKIAGAVLFALLVALGLSIFSEIIFATETPETPGYAMAVAETGEGGHGGAGGGEAPASQPIAVLLATADAAAGEASARKCVTCHTFGQGEPNKVGPNLWEIVNRPIASHEGYEYSEPMHAFAEQAKTWDYEHLNTYLQNPPGTVPKTKMAFAGLKNDEERANVIAYLRTLAASPAPLPQAAAAEPAAPAEAAAAPGAEAPAPAEGQAAAPAEAAPQGAGEPAAAEAPAAAPAEQQAAQSDPVPATPVPAETAAPAEQQAAQPSAPAEPATPAEQQVAQQEPAPAAPAAAAPAAAPAGGFAALVAAGDVAKGGTFAKRCAACHTFEKDGANKVGPHLWGIVDRPIASVADFEYSPAMTAFAAGGKTWTYDELSAYLENPKAHIPENKMAFPGVKKDTDRANLTAYLRTLADTPAPLPAQ